MWEHAQYIHQSILKRSEWVVWYQNKLKGHNLWIKDGPLRWLKGHLIQNANITSSFPISPWNSSHRQVGISPLHQEAFLATCNFQTQRLRSYHWTQTLSVFFPLKNQMAIMALPFPDNIYLTKFYLHASTLLSILKRASTERQALWQTLLRPYPHNSPKRLTPLRFPSHWPGDGNAQTAWQGHRAKVPTSKKPVSTITTPLDFFFFF